MKPRCNQNSLPPFSSLPFPGFPILVSREKGSGSTVHSTVVHGRGRLQHVRNSTAYCIVHPVRLGAAKTASPPCIPRDQGMEREKKREKKKQRERIRGCRRKLYPSLVASLGCRAPTAHDDRADGPHALHSVRACRRSDTRGTGAGGGAQDSPSVWYSTGGGHSLASSQTMASPPSGKL